MCDFCYGRRAVDPMQTTMVSNLGSLIEIVGRTCIGTKLEKMR